jgi:prepilin-type N-terminal cleavage/methylation domain-containing protein
MFHTIKKAQQGFTIIELLIVIAITAILAGLLLNSLRATQAKRRDTQRVSDVTALGRKLEEYYNETGAYPSSVVATELPGINTEALKDPKDKSINNIAPVTDAAAAKVAAEAAVNATTNYAYVAYPTACTTAAKDCTGYSIRTYIEKPSTTTPNPFGKDGLNNN